jgi:hypothetical protein
MRVAWFLVLFTWLAGLSSGPVVAAALSDSESGIIPTVVPLFHDGAFVLVPTPTQEADNPLFYRGSFRAPLQPQAIATTLPPVPPSAGAAAVFATPAPSSTPTPYATSTPAAIGLGFAAPAGPPPTVTPTPFVLGREPDPRFHEGGFYLPPLTPNAIDEPDTYRGSVTADPGGMLSSPYTPQGTLPEVPYGAFVPKDYVPVTGDNDLQPSYTEQSPLPVYGRAMYYNPGIMAAVYTYRLQNQEIKPCPECVGYVALLRAGDLNRKVWLRWEDGTVEGPFLVIDVAARHHVPLLLSRNWVVDVDYQTALRRNMYSPVPVTVLASPPYDVTEPPDFRMEITLR